MGKIKSSFMYRVRFMEIESQHKIVSKRDGLSNETLNTIEEAQEYYAHKFKKEVPWVLNETMLYSNMDRLLL